MRNSDSMKKWQHRWQHRWQHQMRPKHKHQRMSSSSSRHLCNEFPFKAIAIYCIILQVLPSYDGIQNFGGVCALSTISSSLSIRGNIAAPQKLQQQISPARCLRHSDFFVLNSNGGDSENIESANDDTEETETSFPEISDHPSQKTIEVSELDVRYGLRSPLTYDSSSQRYIPVPQQQHSPTAMEEKKRTLEKMPRWRRKLRHSPPLKFYRRHVYPILHSSFLPEGVSPSYYKFIRWRIAQRFFNANVHVFGTQSLLLGLGVKSKSAAASSAMGALGLSAALTWVLKDALGKIVRMIWASRMGRKFDPDAKRWRFRSSLVFAMGNGLEVTSYIYPQLFLLWATLANCCKQVSMLTSSATRNALYNSFKVGNRENIGDITAKGEAQIAVVDLLGIATGVQLSRAVGISVKSVLSVWIALQAVEIFCMYHEIRSVIYRVLNYERLCSVVDSFLEGSSTSTTGERRVVEAALLAKRKEDVMSTKLHYEDEDAVSDFKSSSYSNYNSTDIISTPNEVANAERIFLPPNYLARRAIAFGSIGRARLSPDELDILVSDIFRGEKFMLVVGEDIKNDRAWKRWLKMLSRKNDQESKMIDVFFSKRWKRIRKEATSRKTIKPNGEKEEEMGKEETGDGTTQVGKGGKQLNSVITTAVEKARRNCHIVLHADANNADIVKSTLALMILRRKLANKTNTKWRDWENKCFDDNNKGIVDETCLSPPLPSSSLRTSDCMEELKQTSQEVNELFPKFLNTLTDSGWLPPARFMFGRVSMRAEWPVQKGKVGGGSSGGGELDEADGGHSSREGSLKGKHTATIAPLSTLE